MFDEEVVFIRALLARGFGATDIAREYGFAKRTVDDIKYNHRYADVHAAQTVGKVGVKVGWENVCTVCEEAESIVGTVMCDGCHEAAEEAKQ